MRTLQLAILLASLPVAAAVAADPPRTIPAPTPAPAAQVDASQCWHEAVTNGHQTQPRPGDLACLNNRQSPAQAQARSRQVEKDEADIQQILKRYENSPPIEGAER